MTPSPSVSLSGSNGASISREEAEDIVIKIAEESSSGCGCSYEVYTSKLSRSIDDVALGMNDESRAMLIEVARKKTDYISSEEEDQRNEALAANGYCRHGLTSDTCPCGCFEY